MPTAVPSPMPTSVPSPMPSPTPTTTVAPSLAPLPAPSPAPSPMPTYYSLEAPFSNRTYYVTEPLNFFDCVDTCGRLGAAPACVRDEAEDNFLRTALAARNSEDPFRYFDPPEPGRVNEMWIGIFKPGDFGCGARKWEWVSTACDARYANWRSRSELRFYKCARQAFDARGWYDTPCDFTDDNTPTSRAACVCEARVSSAKHAEYPEFVRDCSESFEREDCGREFRSEGLFAMFVVFAIVGFGLSFNACKPEPEHKRILLITYPWMTVCALLAVWQSKTPHACDPALVPSAIAIPCFGVGVALFVAVRKVGRPWCERAKARRAKMKEAREARRAARRKEAEEQQARDEETRLAQQARDEEMRLAQTPGKMPVHVVTLSGERVRIDADAGDTVELLKLRVQSKTSIDRQQQRLLVDHVEISSGTLGENRVEEGTLFHLVVTRLGEPDVV